ncbi:hypothetical protein Q9233_016491 [Columba guinea]|nr:hypothetical protein Q9233_016491 [Columba guinea]
MNQDTLLSFPLYEDKSTQLRSSSELGQDLLNDCLAIQPLQLASSPHDAADNTVGRSPGPAHDIYPVCELFNIHIQQVSEHEVAGEQGPDPGFVILADCQLQAPVPPAAATKHTHYREGQVCCSSSFSSPHQPPENFNSASHYAETDSTTSPPSTICRNVSKDIPASSKPFLSTKQPPHPRAMGASAIVEAGITASCSKGFYGQLQTFCPPHYADTQKNVQHGTSCNMVPSFEDSLVPTSVGQAGIGIFHRTFSAHSGVTVYDFPAGSTGIFGDSARSMPEDSSFLQVNAVDRCSSQLSSVYTEG